MKKFSTEELSLIKLHLMIYINGLENVDLFKYDQEALDELKKLDSKEYTISDMFYILVDYIRKTESFTTEFEAKNEAHDRLTYVIETNFGKEFYSERKDDLLYMNKEFNKKTAYAYAMECQAIEGEAQLNEQQLKEFLDSFVD